MEVIPNLILFQTNLSHGHHPLPLFNLPHLKGWWRRSRPVSIPVQRSPQEAAGPVGGQRKICSRQRRPRCWVQAAVQPLRAPPSHGRAILGRGFHELEAEQ